MVPELLGSILFSVDAPRLELPAGAASAEVPVVVTATRCDRHALIESETSFTFPYLAAIDGGEPARLSVTAWPQVRQALDLVLQHAEPFPALVVDRHWNLVRANSGLGLMLHGVAPHLLEPPVNVLRVSLHPDGLAPHLEGFGAYSAHVLAVLRREAAALQDVDLLALHDELAGYPGVAVQPPLEQPHGVVLPVRLRTPYGVLSFFTTIARFGTAADVTLAELSVESFFPADDATREAVLRLG